MKQEIQKYLLELAREVILEKFRKVSKMPEKPKDADILDEERGVFVTLEMKIPGSDRKQLRGCIGNIVPVYPLEEAVRRNAINAAFEDPRFMPLTFDEFQNVEIEISVLSVPEKLEYKDAEDLLKKLEPLRDGVILKKSYFEATYLPQVWEDLSDKEQFLSSLCAKAGMDPEEWRSGEVEVRTYQAEVF